MSGLALGLGNVFSKSVMFTMSACGSMNNTACKAKQYIFSLLEIKQESCVQKIPEWRKR